jgi:hypothetical protein
LRVLRLEKVQQSQTDQQAPVVPVDAGLAFFGLLRAGRHGLRGRKSQSGERQYSCPGLRKRGQEGKQR